MQKLRKILFFLFLTSTVVLAGCGSDSKDKGPVLASFNGGKVTAGELQKGWQELPARVQLAAKSNPERYLDSVVSEKLLLQEAESRGLQHLAEVDRLLNQARDRILTAKLIQDEVETKSTVDPKEARSYYETHKAEFVTPYRLRASHILVRSREEADKVLVELQAGLAFDEAAKKYSMDPTAARGGDIGFFQQGQLIPEIEEVAFSLKSGAVSEVVQSSFGYHIVKVTGEAKPQAKEFELVEKEITEKLVIQKRTELFNALLDRLKKKSNLKVYEDALKKVEFTSAAGASKTPETAETTAP